MRKSVIIKWILVSGFIILSLSLLFSKRWSSMGNDFERLTRINIDAADRIELLGLQDSLILLKEDSLWMFPGSEVLNQVEVDNILYAISKLNKVSISSTEHVENPEYIVQVSVWKAKKKLSAFDFIMKDGLYFLLDAREGAVWGIELPGYSDFPLEKVFSHNSDHFRQHLLIDLLPSEINEIHVSPLKGTAFVALQDSLNNMQVLNLASGSEKAVKIDEHKLRLLFSYFNAIRYNEVVTPEMIAPSALSDAPLSIIEVKSFREESFTIRVFPWFKTSAEEPDLFQALVLFNDLPYLLSVDYFYLDLLMRGLEQYMSN